MARGFIFDGIGPVLDYMILSTGTQVTQAMWDAADEAELYAKMNAPWEDRTGEARAGLYADVREEFGEIVLELGHGAEHGLWLEVAMNGRYAIIMPTLEAIGPRAIREAGGKVVDTGGY